MQSSQPIIQPQPYKPCALPETRKVRDPANSVVRGKEANQAVLTGRAERARGTRSSTDFVYACDSPLPMANSQSSTSYLFDFVRKETQSELLATMRASLFTDMHPACKTCWFDFRCCPCYGEAPSRQRWGSFGRVMGRMEPR